MTEPNALNDVDKLVLAGIDKGVFEDRVGRTLLQLYRHGILDPWVVGSITGRVNRKLREEAFSTIPFQMPRLHKGDLILGFDEHGNPICVPFQWLNAGSLTVANTGSGKTTLACFHAAQMAHRVRGMWLTDVRKREFRLLRPELAKQGLDLMVVRSRKLRVNPMQVARDTDPREFASVLSDTLVKVLNLPPRAAVLLTSTIVKLYEEYGVFRGAASIRPSFIYMRPYARTAGPTPKPARRFSIIWRPCWLPWALKCSATTGAGPWTNWPNGPWCSSIQASPRRAKT